MSHFLCTMAKRVTLVSDATNEFPQNKNNSFRMRIPNGLRLEGKGWHVALMSLTLPNQTQFVTGHGNTIVRVDFSAFAFKNFNASTKKFTAVDHVRLVNTNVEKSDIGSVTDGPSFWNNVVRALAFYIDETVTNYRKTHDVYIFVKQTMCPTFTWDGEDLVLHKRGRDASNNNVHTPSIFSSFDIALEVAVQWGLVQQSSDGTWEAGPNLHVSLYGGGDKITASDPPRTAGLGLAGVESMLGPTYRVDFRNDMPLRGGRITSVATGSNRFQLLWHYTAGSAQWIRLSGLVEWRFINLNKTFNALHKHPSNAVMVYSNLQQATIVGEKTVQLLREIVVNRSAEDGHSYAEPKQLQWIPVASNSMDIAEVQIADVNGPLLSLPPGKSLITVAFQQMV